MSVPEAGLLDTSVFIAREDGRPLGELPARVAVSVVTIGELQLGVLNAADDAARARRADFLALARAADPIPISEAVMGAWARFVVACRAAGIQRAVRLIAATAAEHGLRVVTQDGDFEGIAAAHGERLRMQPRPRRAPWRRPSPHPAGPDGSPASGSPRARRGPPPARWISISGMSARRTRLASPVICKRVPRSVLWSSCRPGGSTPPRGNRGQRGAAAATRALGARR